MLWLEPSCATVHRYDDSPALSFEELDYGKTELKHFDVGGVDMVYTDAGPRDGKALILIHGLGENLGFWKKNAATLAKYRRVVTLDLPGFGRSAKPEQAFTMAYYADAIAALMLELQIERATLVGHSMGGQVALTLALNRPEQVEALVLVAPAGIETFDAGEQTFLKDAVSTDLYVNQTEDSIRSNYRNSLFYEWKPEYEEMVEVRTRLAKSPEFKAYAWAVVQCIHAMLDEPVKHRLSEIAVPTLVLFGRQDALIPNPVLHGGESATIGQDAVDSIRGAELVMIDEAGHMLQYEKPDTFNDTVATWLSRNGL